MNKKKAPVKPDEQTHTDRALDRVLMDFVDTRGEWENIDDVVMGGISLSHLRIVDGVAIFEGVVSLENNGGFASVRSVLRNCDLSQYDGILVRVRGDGKQYGLRLRPSIVRGGIGYEACFKGTTAQWTDERLPFAEFRPVFRGRQAPECGPLDPGKVAVLGFIVSGHQAGPFRLEIDYIIAYKERNQS